MYLVLGVPIIWLVYEIIAKSHANQTDLNKLVYDFVLFCLCDNENGKVSRQVKYRNLRFEYKFTLFSNILWPLFHIFKIRSVDPFNLSACLIFSLLVYLKFDLLAYLHVEI